MLSKFSVKKPYTVVVAVVLALILGFVSFTNMTTDLLPDINLPYAVVMTTYVGASPEEVEETVTKPIEEAMATVSNIETMQSISSENYSLVILQFAQTTDMDSVSLEMRENLDQIGSSWDDSVGSPIIMKINPEMMPVIVAAVDMEGMDSIEISDLVDQEIISDLESLEGVASVSTSGSVEESVQVIIRQEKVDEVNVKIRSAISEEFAEAQEELDDAQAELDEASQSIADAQAEIDSGQAELSAAQEELLSQLPAAESEINSAESELLENKTDLQISLATVESSLSVIEESLAEGGLLDQSQEQIDEALETLNAEENLAALAEQKTTLEASIAEVQEAITTLEEQIELLPDGDVKTELETQKETLTTQLTELQSAVTAIDEQTTTIEEAVTELETQQQSLDEARAELEEQYATLQATKTTLETYLTQIELGEVEIATALAELNAQEISAMIEMSSAETQLLIGEASLEDAETELESGQEQIDEGQETLDEQKEEALDSSDISSSITPSTIAAILEAQNFSMPAGYVTEDDGSEYLVRVGDEFEDAEEMEDLILFDLGLDGLDPIRLSDVADVIVTDDSTEVYASVNGEAGVLLTMQKQTGYATSEVSDRIQEYFDEAEEETEGLQFTVLMDQGLYIDMIVNSVLQNLLYGALFAIIVLFLFLQDVRPTVIVACSIPISVLCAIVLMYFTGITLNIISLSGLTLGVGMLVDNSIVVIENIYRMRSLGYTRRQAAVSGAKQVAGAIMASTLTTVCVFLPIVFMEGMTRQLFVDMGLTVAYSLLASLVVALTLVPMMSAGLLRREKKQKQGIFSRLTAWYGKIMPTVLRFKPVVFLGALALLVLSAWLCLSRGMVYIPDMESTQLTLSVTMPEDSNATTEETGEMSDQVIERLLEIDDIESVGAMVGSNSGISLLSSGGSTDVATMYLILSDDASLSNAELEEEILDRTADLDCEVEVSSSIDLSSLTSSGLEVEIKGKDLDTLQEIAKDVAEILEGVEGTTDVSDGLEETETEGRIVVDKNKAAEYNLTVAQVYSQVAAELSESDSATVISTDTKDYDVDVIDENTEEISLDDIEDIILTYTDTDGEDQEIALSEVAEFTESEGMTSINRDEQSRYISVTAAIDDDHNVTLVSNEAEEALAAYEVPDGYTIAMTGEDETIMEAMTELVKMLLLAVAFIYLIMVAQFQSLLSPFIVMFTIPLAFTGGFLALLLTGAEFSIIAMLGFVMLSGIIVNNGIVLVDYINQLRLEGVEKKQAIVEAGQTRMRPVMMTALTTIFGLLFMALGVGTGSDMMQGMAIVEIGGLIYGTLLTLFVVPCIYDVLNRRKNLDKMEDLDEI